MESLRFDNTKSFVLKTILLNNRLKAFERYVKQAIEAGYCVCSMENFYKDFKNAIIDKKHFVLRHDVDDLIPATRKMFELEKALGVHSTYYFRWNTIDKKLIDDMLSAGFDVGLHYETVATYIREHKITDKKELPVAEMQEILKDEIKRFKIEYNHNMTSCCSHGAKENVDLDISGNILMEDVDYRGFEIEFEAYDKDMYAKCDIYHVMDGNIRYNFGFSYKSNPLEGIAENHKNIVFLAHPVHWKFGLISYITNLCAFCLGRYTCSTEREFMRIAK